MYQFATAKFSENVSSFFCVLVSSFSKEQTINHYSTSHNTAPETVLVTGGGFLEPALCSGGVTVGRVARRSRGVAVDGVETGDGSRPFSAQ